jgi:hypothetical protein
MGCSWISSAADDAGNCGHNAALALSQRPAVRIKRVESAGVHVTRIAEPIHDINRNVVEVNYTFIVDDERVGRAEQIKELTKYDIFFG